MKKRSRESIGGSSLGGLISLYAIYHHPDVFSQALVVSPALWWADFATMKYAEENKPEQPIRIWVDMGSEEGRRRGQDADEVTEAVEHARKLVAMLEEQGLKRVENLTYLEVEGGKHHEADWSRRFDQMLSFRDGKKAE